MNNAAAFVGMPILGLLIVLGLVGGGGLRLIAVVLTLMVLAALGNMS